MPSAESSWLFGHGPIMTRLTPRRQDRGDLSRTAKLLVRVAVAVGFEPTEELPPHTLSRSVDPCSPRVIGVCGLRQLPLVVLGGRRCTGVNETKTETRPQPAVDRLPSPVQSAAIRGTG